MSDAPTAVVSSSRTLGRDTWLAILAMGLVGGSVFARRRAPSDVGA